MVRLPQSWRLGVVWAVNFSAIRLEIENAGKSALSILYFVVSVHG